MPKPGYITFQVDQPDHEALRRLAKRKGYNLSQLGRLAVRRLLKYSDDIPPRPTDHELRASASAAVAS